MINGNQYGIRLRYIYGNSEHGETSTQQFFQELRLWWEKKKTILRENGRRVKRVQADEESYMHSKGKKVWKGRKWMDKRRKGRREVRRSEGERKRLRMQDNWKISNSTDTWGSIKRKCRNWPQLEPRCICYSSRGEGGELLGVSLV